MKKHFFYYIALLLLCGLTLFLENVFSFSKNLQFFLVVFLAFFYALWGVLHHFLHHNLKVRIFIEYIVIACLGVAVVFFILQGML